MWRLFEVGEVWHEGICTWAVRIVMEEMNRLSLLREYKYVSKLDRASY